MEGSRFDRLARTVVAGHPRRAVIKGLAGGALALLGGQSAEAAPGGNSACAHFCDTAFPPGKARGQCTSDAAHGQGLCPACRADIARLCGGVCVDLGSDPTNCGVCGRVCGGGDDCTVATCTGGTCGTAPTNAGGSCNGGAGTCDASGHCVPNGCSPGLPLCLASDHNGGPCPSACFCETSVEGPAFCVEVSHCAGQPNCRSNRDCPPGQACITGASLCFGSFACPEPLDSQTICVALCGQPQV